MDKPILAVDLDDVLAALVSTVAIFMNQEYPVTNKNYELSSFSTYDWDKVFGISVDEVQVRMKKFFESDFFISHMPPIPNALAALTELHSKYSIHIVTSRQTFLEKETKEWLLLNYPNLIDGIHFGNMYGIGPSRRKVDICKELNAVAIIDDIPSTCLSCASGGIFSILFNLDGSYLWYINRWSTLESNQSLSNLKVAKNWEDVVKILKENQL